MWNFRAIVHHHRNGLTSIPSSLTTIASASRRFATPNHHFLQHRLLSFCPPDKLLVKAIATKDDPDLELKRIKDQSLPGIFCFTTYVDPLCFYVARFLRETNQRYAHVAISEIVLDAQADNYESILKDVGISYMPSFHVFKNGEKVNKIGLERSRTDAKAYVKQLKGIFGRLYSVLPTTSSSKRKNKRTTQESDVETLKKDEKGCLRSKLIVSKEEYNLAVNRIQEESLPAVLCFAAYSQHSSKLASEFLQYNISERFPHVAIYEFFLDPKEDDYETTLKSLNITSTPTFHFFKNGENVDELAYERVGFDDYTRDLGKITENLYGPQKLGKQAKKKVIAKRR